MPQAKPNQQSTRAVDSLSDSNPRQLKPNQRLEDRGEAGVFFVEDVIPPHEGYLGPDRTERRVDAPGDADHVAKGGSLWYRKLLKAQEAAKAQESNKTNRKVAPKKGKSNE